MHLSRDIDTDRECQWCDEITSHNVQVYSDGTCVGRCQRCMRVTEWDPAEDDYDPTDYIDPAFVAYTDEWFERRFVE